MASAVSYKTSKEMTSAEGIRLHCHEKIFKFPNSSLNSNPLEKVHRLGSNLRYEAENWLEESWWRRSQNGQKSPQSSVTALRKIRVKITSREIPRVPSVTDRTKAPLRGGDGVDSVRCEGTEWHYYHFNLSP